MIRVAGKFLLTMILMLLIAMTVSGQDFGDISEADLAMGAPEAYPEANALILLDHGTYNIIRWQLEIVRHRRIKILTEAGKQFAGNISIDYHSEDDA